MFFPLCVLGASLVSVVRNPARVPRLQDVNTGRVLVLKRSSLQSHEGRVVYEKEASVMRTLAHPNIVQVSKVCGHKNKLVVDFCT